MRTDTKKIISLFFLLLGNLPWLFILVSAIKEQAICHWMEENLEKKLLQSVTLTEQDIHWAKKGKEIWVHGRLFDIKTMESKNGMILFTGLYDDDETALKKSIQEGWKKNPAGNDISLAGFLACFQNIFFETDTSIFLSVCAHNIFSSGVSPGLPGQYKTILTPPPQG